MKFRSCLVCAWNMLKDNRTASSMNTTLTKHPPPSPLSLWQPLALLPRLEHEQGAEEVHDELDVAVLSELYGSFITSASRTRAGTGWIPK